MKQLKVVSFNLAECVPSAEAPASWNREKVTQVVRQELLRHDPDVLCLQECPEGDWPRKTFKTAGYTLMGAEQAHAGFVALLLRNKLAENAQLCECARLPVVMAEIQFQQNDDAKSDGDHNQCISVLVASCHLQPFGTFDRERSMQIEGLLATVKANTIGKPTTLIIAGDTNMRPSEDQVMEEHFQLRDAWKEAGADPSTQFTWDTRNMRPRLKLFGFLRTSHAKEGSGYFNRFYGGSTQQYTARYDRMYYRSWPSKKDKTRKALLPYLVSVDSFELVANQPVSKGSRTHFLSDHFGIACSFQLNHQKG